MKEFELQVWYLICQPTFWAYIIFGFAVHCCVLDAARKTLQRIIAIAAVGLAIYFLAENLYMFRVLDDYVIDFILNGTVAYLAAFGLCAAVKALFRTATDPAKWIIG